jgi:hypothetical protein
MKSAVFADVSLRAFWDLLPKFAQSLRETFAECDSTADWCLYITNVVSGDDARMRETVKKWEAGMRAPLVKARYAKAVQSVTGAPATVYHALSYKDMESAEQAFESLKALELAPKLKTLDDEARAVFWRYLDELHKHAFAFCGSEPPRVPTPEEIAADIARRKGVGGGGAANAGGGAVVQNGLKQAWRELCEARGGGDFAADTLAARLAKAGAAKRSEGDTVADGCRARSANAFAALAAAMPELGEASVPPDDAQWQLLDKALGLCTMENSISAPMMQGIEKVASQLARDIASGSADLSTLNIEALGQQVLGSVDAKEVSAFANNIDSILPALDQLHRR